MAKEAKIIEGVEEKLFQGFNFLDSPIPKEVTKKTKSVEDTDNIANDDFSEEDEKALNEAVKKSEKIATEKKVVKKETEENINTTDIITEETEVETGVIAEPETIKENEFTAFAKYLAEKGVVDLDETDKVETEEDLDNVVTKTIKNGIEAYKNSKPEDAQKFLEFVDNGGNPADFHKYYYGEASFSDYNVEGDEEAQKYVISEALKLEGFTPEEIEDEINDIVDLNKLEKKAATYLNKLKKVEKEQKEALLEAQKSYAKQQETQRVQEWKEFKDGLYNKETLGGFKVNSKMKDDIWNYMTKPVDKKTGETQYQKDSKENEDARYMFAYLLKNKWDIKALERQVETKQVSKLRDKLTNYTDTRNKNKAAKTQFELEDNNSNPFEAFGKIL